MLVAACVLPHPPLLLPEVAGGAAAELDDVRRACDQALAAVVAARPDLLLLVGSGEPAGEHPAGATGSLAGFGVDLEVELGPGPVDPGRRSTLPAALTVGAWLLARASWPGPVAAVAVPAWLAPAAAVDLGAALAGRAERVGLVVLGDGSARLSPAAPGYVDPRAGPFEEQVAAALGSGDAAALAGLDPDLAEALLAAGRAPWQVLAGAAQDALAGGATLSARLLAHVAPYGVDYLVAAWRVEDAR